MTALRDLPEEERGWQTARRSVQCQICQAVMVFDPARVGQNCEFCGSPALVDYEEIKAPIRPQGVLPFRIDTRPACATTSAAGGGASGSRRRSWRARRSSTPSTASTSRTGPSTRRCIARGTPRPATTTTSRRRPRRQGAGDHAQERRVRWEPASGVVDHFFDDEPVPGTQGLPLDLLRQVEPFPDAGVVPYDTAFLSGHVVEHYQVVLFDAAQRRRSRCTPRSMQLCAQQVPGDTYRNLHIFPDVFGPDVQARPRAGLAAVLQLRREGVSGDRQRLHRQIAGQYP